MSDRQEIRFHNPQQGIVIILNTLNQNKIVPFKSFDAVFLPEVQVKSTVKTYTIGNGLDIIGNNVVGQEKTLRLFLNGSDFLNYKNKTINFEVINLTVLGDVEVEFKIDVV